MPTKSFTFNQGIASPPKLGTVILKPAADGKLSYAQNVTISNDKYGDGVVTPGPYINLFVSGLTNPVYWKAIITQNVGSKNGQMWVGYNAGNTLDYIKGINSGGTPVFENSGTVTLSVSGHSPLISDLVSGQFQNAVTQEVYASLNETSTGYSWIAAFQSSGSITYNALTSTTVAGTTPNPLPMIKTQFDGNIYIGNGNVIDKVNVANASFTTTGVSRGAIGPSGVAIPYEWYITALGEWNGKLVVAANNESPGDFTKRNGGGQSRVFFFDVANNPTGSFLNNFVNSPSHYISVLFTDLSGNLLAFGGVDEGRTTIYNYNGYGFNPLFSYIGDMPRNRHSVCFDAQGRLIWTTANGEVCRLNTAQLMLGQEQAGAFEHIGTIGTTGLGGVCGNLQSTGDDFVVSGGGNLSQMSFTSGAFTGAGNNADTSSTPLVISGIEDLPQKSIVTKTTVSLNKALQSGEIMEARLYPYNYATAGYTLLGTLDYSQDGAIASKNFRSCIYNMDNLAIGIAWKTTNGTTTVPGLMEVDVDYNEISTT